MTAYQKTTAKNLYLSDPSLTYADIAKQVGKTPRTVERWANAEEPSWAEQRKQTAEQREQYAKVTSIQEARQRPSNPRPVRKLTGPIDELQAIDGAIDTLTLALRAGDETPANSLGGIAGGLCKLIELRRKLAPPTAADLAQQVLELGLTPTDFVKELREQWANRTA